VSSWAGAAQLLAESEAVWQALEAVAVLCGRTLQQLERGGAAAPAAPARAATASVAPGVAGADAASCGGGPAPAAAAASAAAALGDGGAEALLAASALPLLTSAAGICANLAACAAGAAALAARPETLVVLTQCVSLGHAELDAYAAAALCNAVAGCPALAAAWAAVARGADPRAGASATGGTAPAQPEVARALPGAVEEQLPAGGSGCTADSPQDVLLEARQLRPPLSMISSGGGGISSNGRGRSCSGAGSADPHDLLPAAGLGGGSLRRNRSFAGLAAAPPSVAGAVLLAPPLVVNASDPPGVGVATAPVPARSLAGSGSALVAALSPAVPGLRQLLADEEAGPQLRHMAGWLLRQPAWM
jgi:hypothetical protein